MRESTIEKYLVKRVAESGGIAEKFVSPGRKNVPDRICQWMGFLDFVEVKAPGVKPKEAQLRDHVLRLRLGHEVWVIDSKESVDKYINYCLRREFQ